MHLLAKQVVLGGDNRGVLKEGVKTYQIQMAPMSPLNSITFFLSSRL